MATKACVPEKAVTLTEEQMKKTEEVMEQGGTKAVSMELSYVTERIIALWFPSLGNDAKETDEEKILEDATSMLRVKHGENCMVFDLSSECHMMSSHYLGWQGVTLAPPLERLCSACKYIESWLSSNQLHVAVLFARGPCSKERIGVIISAYLTYSGICASEEQALDRFAMRRFFQDKIGHLRSPSSVRYVGHFSGLLSGGIRMNAEPLFLKYITVCGAPAYKDASIQRESICFFLKIYQQGLSHVYTSPIYELSPTSEQLTVGVENTLTYPALHLRGDVLLKGYRLCKDCPPRRLHRHSLFQCQFHTCAVAKSSLCFPRAELDQGEDNEVKYPPENGSLELYFYSRNESQSSPLRFSSAPLSSALYLPYADEDEEQAVANSIIAHDSMEELCNKRRQSKPESWTNGVLEEDSGGPDYLTGPVDGSLYATVYKEPRPSSASEAGRCEALESPSHEHHLDELLGDMLMTVENIPDLRASDDEDIPYHARRNGRPFTYGAVPERMHAELSSPSLVRKASRTIPPNEQSSDGNLTWLQLQQQKLRERKERQPHEFSLMKELRTYHRTGIQKREDYSLPLRINTSLETLRTIGSGVVSTRSDGERPFVAVKRAHEYARSLDETPILQSRDDSTWEWEEDEEDETDSRKGKPRPHTPAFPVHPRTPYSNGTPMGYLDHSSDGKASLPPKSPQAVRKDRSQVGVSLDIQGTQSLRPVHNHKQSTVNPATLPRQSHGEHHEVNPVHVKFVRDTSRFWYKPTISREEAIAILKDKPPGTFIVRDSNSFPGAFGLALKVATPPSNVPTRISSNTNVDISNELVRHFLIEPTSRGVKLKGCINEPVFSSLSALVYQHSLTAMALPCQLILPESDPTLTRGVSATDGMLNSNQILLQQGAACNVLYLQSVDTESLTGPQAVRRAVCDLFSRNPLPPPTVVHFKVSGQGITLTDNKRRLFFRRHYPVNGISHCGLDPDDHRWTEKGEEFANSVSSNRCFGFVARKPSTKGDNQCHIFAELDPGQPATAIVNFVTRVMMAGTVGKSSNIV